MTINRYCVLYMVEMCLLYSEIVGKYLMLAVNII